MTKRILLIAAAAAVAVPGVAGAVPVTDSGVIAQTSKIAGFASDQLATLDNIRSEVREMQDAIGAAGIRDGLASAPQFKDYSNGGEIGQALRDFAPNTKAVTGSDGAPGAFESLGGARDYVSQTFFSSGGVSTRERNDYAELRLRALRDAVFNGYALALVTRQQLSKSADRATALQDMVSGATDLRGDLQANSAILLAQHQQMSQMVALLAATLELEATQAIGADGTISATGGGSAPIEVRDPDTVSPTGVRSKTEISPPAGAPSGPIGGSGGMPPVGGANLLPPGSLASAAASNLGGANLSNPADILRLAGETSRLGGNTALGSDFGYLGSYAAGNDPHGLMLAAAGILARGSSGNLSTVLSSGAQALAANDRDGIAALLRMAESAARASGNYQLAASVGAARSAYASGSLENAAAVYTATSAIAQSQGNGAAAELLRQGMTLPTPGPAQMTSATTIVVDSLARATGNAAVRDVARAAAVLNGF